MHNVNDFIDFWDMKVMKRLWNMYVSFWGSASDTEWRAYNAPLNPPGKAYPAPSVFCHKPQPMNNLSSRHIFGAWNRKHNQHTCTASECSQYIMMQMCTTQWPLTRHLLLWVWVWGRDCTRYKVALFPPRVSKKKKKKQEVRGGGIRLQNTHN